MALVDEVALPILYDIGGGLPLELGLRTYTVARQIVTWDGGDVGAGADTVTDTLPLLPSVEVVQTSEAVLKVGPIVPRFDDGRGPTGYTPAQLNPKGADLPADSEVRYLVTGPDGERFYRLTGIDDTDPFGYFLTLESLDRAPPF